MPKKTEKRDREAQDDQVPNINEPVAKHKRIEDDETGKRQTMDQVANIDEPATDGEKGEELLTSEGEKRPFICAIYKRDILSFLPRRKIEELRTVSRRWDFDIVTTPPAMLPRRVYYQLEVLIGEGRGYLLTKDGFVSGSSRRMPEVDIRGRALQREFLWFQRCCTEIKNTAGQELNGQLVFPHRGANDVVVVRLLPRRYGCCCSHSYYSDPVFRAPNKLSEETAGTLIHFLSHIDGCCVARLRVQAFFPELSDESGEPIGVLNPRIFDAYRAALKKTLRLYARRVEMALPFSKTTLATAGQLVVGKLNGVCNVSDGGRVDEMLALLSSTRPHCSMVEFYVESPLFVDQLVEFYCNYTGDVESLAQEVRLPYLSSYGAPRWPATCPMEDAQESGPSYVYSFVNAASGWKFEVTLVWRDRGGSSEPSDDERDSGEEYNGSGDGEGSDFDEQEEEGGARLTNIPDAQQRPYRLDEFTIGSSGSSEGSVKRAHEPRLESATLRVL